MSMGFFKAPGKDDFKPIFFKTYWEVVSDDVWKLVHKATENENFNRDIVETLVVLIPK